MLQTEFEFTLPKGYIDQDGNLHREGTMRLATAADEILPLKDPRVQSNSAYLVIILMSRVVMRLGSLEVINPKIIEGLFAADLTYLQSLYNQINHNQPRLQAVICPNCQQQFEVEVEYLGESSAIP